MKILALVERSRQMEFQVDRATHRLWFWLKRIGERDLSLAKTQILVLVKEDRQRDLSLAKTHIF
jgi:hypothetical protein